MFASSQAMQKRRIQRKHGARDLSLFIHYYSVRQAGKLASMYASRYVYSVCSRWVPETFVGGVRTSSDDRTVRHDQQMFKEETHNLVMSMLHVYSAPRRVCLSHLHAID